MANCRLTIVKCKWKIDNWKLTDDLKGQIMAKAAMPHPSHSEHLCYLTNLGFQLSNPKEYKALVKGGKFYCKICGRVAAGEKSLCKSAKL
jgi:hypothetical protein